MRASVVVWTCLAALLTLAALQAADVRISRQSDRAGLEALLAKTEIGVQQVLWGRSR